MTSSHDGRHRLQQTDHSASSLRVNLEQIEGEQQQFQNSEVSCRIASCSAALVTVDSPVCDTSNQVDLSQLDLHLKTCGKHMLQHYKISISVQLRVVCVQC